ncbi:putative retrotransposon nucleocapsid protein, partial [Puccinia sorghi]
VKTLQGFLGFANFYQKVIKNYSKTIKAFPTAPILTHFSELTRTLIETNASDYAVAGVISQYSSLNLLHPVAFKSRKLHNSELNYKIHEKELLAIVFCLQKWHSYLISLPEPFEVLTDHNDRWAEFLLEFHFNIPYQPGKLEVVPDALSLGLNSMKLHSKTLELQDAQLSDP